jgi:hypothetical protein
MRWVIAPVEGAAAGRLARVHLHQRDVLVETRCRAVGASAQSLAYEERGQRLECQREPRGDGLLACAAQLLSEDLLHLEDRDLAIAHRPSSPVLGEERRRPGKSRTLAERVEGGTF